MDTKDSNSKMDSRNNYLEAIQLADKLINGDDCTYGMIHCLDHYYNGAFNDDLDRFDKLRSEIGNDAWIPIGDRLPEEGEYVLGFRPFAKELGDARFTVLRFNGYVSVDHKGNTHGFERYHFVSHWQPLIEPK